jgi:quercetin dioxygenase-like cupin family protein
MANLIRNVPVTVFLALALAPALAGAADHVKAMAVSHDDPALEWGPCPPFLPEGCRIAVLHGNPAEPNADVFFKIPAGDPIPHHYHTSAERMILVSGELSVTYDGQAPVVMKTGDYAYGPPGLPHEGTCAQGDPCILFIAFESAVDAIPTGE